MERNEDSILELELDGRYCFVVADGLGGHGYGEDASKLLVEVFEREFKDATDNCGFLARAFDRAQEEILSLQDKMGATNQMKTTAVALSIMDGKCAWAHVGDSRLHHFRRGVLAGRTIDHSVPQMLALSGEITEEEIRKHPDRSRLLRAVGDKWDAPRYEISKEIPLRKVSALLLCSDGFWEHLSGGSLCPPPGAEAKAWLEKMQEEAEKTAIAEEMDNYSAIAICVG